MENTHWVIWIEGHGSLLNSTLASNKSRLRKVIEICSQLPYVTYGNTHDKCHAGRSVIPLRFHQKMWHPDTWWTSTLRRDPLWFHLSSLSPRREQIWRRRRHLIHTQTGNKKRGRASPDRSGNAPPTRHLLHQLPRVFGPHVDSSRGRYRWQTLKESFWEDLCKWHSCPGSPPSKSKLDASFSLHFFLIVVSRLN